ncbi:MAG TPA: hypothetical protein PK295_00340 [Candidatus Magasanikbacteria bacterium]|nr:hypothetical protein [Candidatus Magasanikbacteria bacterium]
MIATIVPLKRLPRHTSLFDYSIPTELEDTIAQGQLVQIQLRKTLEFGVVISVSAAQNSNYAYKPITAIVHDIPLFPPATQSVLRELSILYATSLATLYKTSSLPIQKRKIKKIALEPHTLVSIPESKFEESYVLYNTAEEEARFFSSLDHVHTTLILVPEVTQIETLKNILQKNNSPEVVIWQSDLSEKDKFNLWLRVRNNIDPIIILGTRSSLALPFTRLDRIIITHEHDEQYKSYDQQPKYHARDVVRLLGTQYQSQCIYTSFSPSFDLYYKIVKEKMPCIANGSTYSGGLLFETRKAIHETIHIIEHTPQPRDGRVSSIITEERIVEVATKKSQDIVILVQRKGFATMVVCKNCGHIETSPLTGLPMTYREDTRMMHGTHGDEQRPLPTTCSVCKSTMMLLRGAGTEKIASYFSELFTKEDILIPVFRIDDNTSADTLAKLNDSTPRVIIGTEKIFPHIRPESTGLYVILDLERYLAIPEFQTFEHVVHLLSTFNYLRNTNSQFIIETNSSDKPIFKLFSEPDRIYRTELSLRQKLGYSPYQSVIKYTLSSVHKSGTRTRAEHFREDITRQLTQANIIATVSEIFETHPAYHKGMYWWGVIVKTAPKDVRRVAELLTPYLPTGCVVDLNPISIFSP